MSLTDSSVVNAATALNDDLSSNGCQAVATASVSGFQTAYNAAGGSPALAVDGLYGANTAGALQAVINANPGTTLGSYTAPAGCVSQGNGGGGGGSTPVVVSTGGTGVGALPYIVGALVVAGALAAYTYSHKKKRR